MQHSNKKQCHKIKEHRMWEVCNAQCERVEGDSEKSRYSSGCVRSHTV